MPFSDALITVIASAAMVILFFLSFIPLMPSTLLMWLMTFAYAWATNFQHLTWLPFILITLMTLVGITSDWWMPLFGMKGRGASWRSVVGTIGGGLLGTFLIPIPILGTLLGGIGGAFGLELLYNRDVRSSVRAGTFAAESFVRSLILAILLNFAILIVFFAAVLIP
jgi:hypothetical protein